MGHWLKNPPGLVFVRELSTWLVVNHKCEPIICIEGESELAWYFACLECGANDRTQLRVVEKFQRPEATYQNTQRGRLQRDRRRTGVVVPMRVP